ncbi:LpxI family protein [Palleronia caenipelagi]|uniref:LpxI family protein n=1 Tax=Palleronia caenipelagi TaxID=2489174 RepID=A0A547Q643_9RHOB|nr:UDP-2,3-diacylglucosamine diphosphatase LpxI [Palleronia caenipelagi]TRD21842.1 LpxI family protein [Palleronia caenipelagi]
MSDLCLIAGAGRLPELIAAAEPGVLVAVPEGATPGDLPLSLTFRLETLGSFLAELKTREIKRLCFAGGLTRPGVDPALIDEATQQLVPRLMAALRQGDDGALRTLIEMVEEAGFVVVGATDLLPELLPEAGVLGRVEPDDRAMTDIGRAEEVLTVTGPADIGQGCVVASGQVLAMEAMPGTEWMLASLAAARAGGPLAASLPDGGVLVKAPKPRQERRIDMPAIGPDTIWQAAEAGLRGVAVAAGGVMILDREATIAEADRLGLFLAVRA